LKGSIKIDATLCKGCGLCVEACPNKIIEIGTQRNGMGYFYAVIKKESKKRQDGKGCTGCTLCAMMCPEVAIEVYREKR